MLHYQQIISKTKFYCRSNEKLHKSFWSPPYRLGQWNWYSEDHPVGEVPARWYGSNWGEGCILSLRCHKFTFYCCSVSKVVVMKFQIHTECALGRIGWLLDSLYTHSWFPAFHTQQQYKFVYATIKHYVESQQALMNVVSNNKIYTVNKDFSFGLTIRSIQNAAVVMHPSFVYLLICNTK